MKQFDNIDDALREVVQRAGGLKTVGALLWPELGDERARLQREFIASIHTLTELAARIESMDARDVPGIRSVS